MPTSLAAFPSNASFLGLAKEATRGTALAPTDYIPVKPYTAPNDMAHYVPDRGFRGSAVDAYSHVATQIWAEPSFPGDVFPDTFGYWLYMLFGGYAFTAGTPNVHVFSLLNTSPFQPPSYCLTEYNGTDTFQIPGALVSELSLKFNAVGLLEYTAKAMGFRSATTTKPTQSFSTETVKPAWQGAVTLGGAATSILEDATINLKRKVAAIPTVNGSQDPAAIWGGDLSIDGQMNLVLLAGNTEYARYTGNTSTTLDVNFTAGAGAAQRALQFHASNVIYTSAAHKRDKEWMELAISFSCDANTTDIGASGGYGPAVVTLKNARATY